ncbi:hypothetical protein [Haloferax mucosum]|uniref:hypothetical protein n=1 Tax=Haloferax mucosum TaxID=403181 RepID=UPI00126754F2|nr:hypothetical protein [Haloferax mucosum]
MRDNTTRRKSMKIAATSLLGMVGLAKTGSAREKKSSQEYNFNPDDSQEVGSFIKENDPLNNPEIADHLSAEQVSAVLDFYAENVEWSVEKSVRNDTTELSTGTSSAATSSAEPIHAEVVTKGKTPIAGTVEYTFEANFQWYAHGEGNGYSELSHSSFGQSNALAGHYVRGSRMSGQTDIYSDYFTAWESGQFKLELGADWRTVTAKIEIRGDETGDWTVTEETSPV